MMMQGYNTGGCRCGESMNDDPPAMGVVAAITAFQFPPRFLSGFCLRHCDGKYVCASRLGRVPLTIEAARIELFRTQIGLAEGFVNMVNAQDCRGHILDHPKVRAVSFVG